MNNERENLVKAYQETFNTDYGRQVIEHLRQVGRLDDHAIDMEISDKRLRGLYYLRCLVNYMEYMCSVQNFTGPDSGEGTVPDPLDQIIENEI